MILKNLGLFFKVFILFLIAIVLALVIGRNHFLLGTIFILLRWIFFIVALGLFYLASRRITPKLYKVALIVVLLIIPVEYVWIRTQRQSLKKDLLSTEISVMTYNVFFKNWNVNSSIKEIQNCDPDILLLQELTPGFKDKLESSIGSSYRYRKTLAMKGTHGMGVYSKFPIINSRFLENRASKPFGQVLDLEIITKKIRIINAHLASPAIAVENPDNFIELFGSNSRTRSQQLSIIKETAIEGENEFSAQLLVGDLNTISYEPLYQDIEKEWVNLYDIVGDDWGFNFPHTEKMRPILTLDYLFGRGSIECVEMKVIKGGGSDHLPIMGKIKI